MAPKNAKAKPKAKAAPKAKQKAKAKPKAKAKQKAKAKPMAKAAAPKQKAKRQRMLPSTFGTDGNGDNDATEELMKEHALKSLHYLALSLQAKIKEHRACLPAKIYTDLSNYLEFQMAFIDSAYMRWSVQDLDNCYNMVKAKVLPHVDGFGITVI